VFATNHKDIGTLYMLFSFAMLMLGGVLALGIRTVPAWFAVDESDSSTN
jgi:heme/copper-type cytochrome/quinol oxidase subunit 1